MLINQGQQKNPAVTCNYPDTPHLFEWSVWKIPVYLWNTTHRRHSKSPPPCSHPPPPPPVFSHPSPLARLHTSPASFPLSCWVTGWRTPGTILMYRQKDGRTDGWLGQRKGGFATPPLCCCDIERPPSPVITVVANRLQLLSATSCVWIALMHFFYCIS